MLRHCTGASNYKRDNMIDMAMTIGRQQVRSRGNIPVINPATGEQIGTVPNTDLPELDRAVSAAKAAFPAWSGLPDESRKALLARLAELLESQSGMLARPAYAKAVAMQLECGSVWINRHGAIQPNAPFGGLKNSGLGMEFGEEGLYANTDIQVIYQ